jgi:hypothetical protein
MPVRLRLPRLPWAIFYHDNKELTGNLEKRTNFFVSLELCGWFPSWLVIEPKIKRDPSSLRSVGMTAKSETTTMASAGCGGKTDP